MQNIIEIQFVLDLNCWEISSDDPRQHFQPKYSGYGDKEDKI